ncbi:COX15/CtaA family protein [Methylopila turkensis]|uniref:Heme A synthase n=1 Tax=Methylopila turkensis TaxID=1437816 RepID=A0A9W6JRC0_9HYPH|nr:COX15/CtaA family protein [Methylopila turkensis]GLK81033.1 heme A synthase [Methylopila turkensis]
MPDQPFADRPRRFVRGWLILTLLMVALMVVVGGATRLTGSGLSITEWRPVTGAIPPIGEAAWALEFDKYRASPQYKLLNEGMSLGEFQFIYWWEWGHRQLGRAIGLVFALGLAFAAVTRRVSLTEGLTLFGMGLLLGMQGAVGWIMVASGLQPGMTAVAPIKLTLHLGLALIFFASIVLFLVHLRQFGRDGALTPGRLRAGAYAVLGLSFVQILLGGLVAGSRAGFTFNTWPLMDGGLAPSASTLFAVTPWWENFVDNVALVQLNHRIGAYVLLAATIAYAVAVARAGLCRRVRTRAIALAHLMIVQAALGVAALVLVVPLWAGLAHQFGAVVVLGLAVMNAGILHERAARERAGIAPGVSGVVRATA